MLLKARFVICFHAKKFFFQGSKSKNKVSPATSDEMELLELYNSSKIYCESLEAKAICKICA